MLAKLANDPLFVVICSAGGLLITAYGVWLTIKLQQLNAKLPRYTRRSIAIIRADAFPIEELSHKFAGYGKPIENLTLTKLLLWNTGNVPIKPDDVAPAAPIRIHARNEAVILNVKLTNTTNEVAQFHPELKRTDRTTIDISFDFLQRGDSFLLSILHTGKNDGDLDLEGQIIGSGPFVLVPFQKFVSSSKRRGRTNFTAYAYWGAKQFAKSRYKFTIAIALTFMALFSFMFSLVKTYAAFEKRPAFDAFMITLIEMQLFVLPAAFWARVSYLLFYSLPPAFFDVFESDSYS